MESLISLIMPTKDRYEFVKRFLDYYSNKKFKGEIIICDSSKKDILNKTSEYIKTLNIDIKHYHKNLPPNKFEAFALNKTKKKYSALIADDDILFVKGINECINYLEKNQDFIACNGQVYNFSLGPMMKANGTLLGFENYVFHSSDSETNKKRIINYLQKRDSLLSSVIRRKALSSAMDLVVPMSDYHSVYVYGESIPSIFILNLGKVKTLQVDYCARQAHMGSLYSKYNIFNMFCDYEMNIANRIFLEELEKSFDKIKSKIIVEQFLKSILEELITMNNYQKSFIYKLYSKFKILQKLKYTFKFYIKNKNKFNIPDELKSFFKISNIQM